MIRNKRKQMKLEFYRKISKLHIPKTQYLSLLSMYNLILT